MKRTFAPIKPLGLPGRYAGSRKRFKQPAAILMGTVAPAIGDVIGEQYAASIAEAFQQFLPGILDRYIGKRIHLVLDKAKIPHAKA